MRSRRHLSGGVLWDAFLILVLCGGAFFAWKNWDRWKGFVTKIPGVSKGKHTEPVTLHLDRRSAVAQAQVRQFLTTAGVGEKNILKSFNEERRSGGVFWLESTLEITRPKKFQSGPFLKKLLVFLSKNDLALMRDETDQRTWTLEFGDRDHVFQRLVIRAR